jgi:hypothetical protein
MTIAGQGTVNNIVEEHQSGIRGDDEDDEDNQAGDAGV